MPFNAVLGSQQFSDVQIIDRTHPAIIRGAAFRQDGRVLPRGRVVAKDSNGAMAAYEPGLAAAVAWVAATVYAAGALALPTVANGHYYRCATGGTSHTAEPTWPTTAEATVTDATAVWEEAGLIGVDDLAGGGVLAEAIDTAVEGVGPVLRHGTVVADNLDVAGAAAATADIAALEAIGIYAI
ncbi:MAG: hypothetical protein L6271_10150 [Desulfobacteraceae bacterium]|nr:hypothetical protein [Pseudomonadota bacterium]MCG2744267.1 hypothetical protein [Desulfobacteraceae bacterium]